MDRLVKLEPSNQVVIRIEPGQRCYGVLTLRNVMYTMPVAFRVLPLNQARFTIRPQTGIIAPLSTLRIEITYLPQQPTAPLIPDCVPRSDDCFYVDSVVCVGATSSALDAVPSSWFNAKKKQVFTDSGLRIFYTGSAVLARLIEDGKMEKVRDVLEQSDPDWHAADSTDAQGRTLLQLAIARGRADLVQLLIEFSADVEAASQGRSPLEAAAAYGQTIIAELLLARGASTAQSQRSAYGPLHLAAAGGHSELLRLLLLHGAEVDAVATDGRTALHLTIAEKRRDCSEILISAGARADACGGGGDTPLHVAAAAGDEVMARLLIAGGCAGLKDARNRAGKTAYDVAKEERQRRFFDLMKAEESLMAAARRGDVRALSRAIEIGAAVDGRDGSGWTALMMAGFKGWMEVIRVLLAKGAQIDARDEEGYTALHCAVEAGQAEAVEMLVKRGADLMARTAKGKTAVEIAGALGYVGIVRILVRGGAVKVCEQAAMVVEVRPVLGKGKKNGNRIACGSGGGGRGGRVMRAGFVDRTTQWRWRAMNGGEFGRRVIL
ncbi:hypothetical protein KFK09_019641 [Dendrobium nobile]|uniref:MSP domain-containing protein n=1 Tax=Dendrobium nobile TaxID=94219 RepID=A0A8T3AQY0_DENNO|nr:hypothetical protein KFK09_019641 [Dendrobium nobile]